MKQRFLWTKAHDAVLIAAAKTGRDLKKLHDLPRFNTGTTPNLAVIKNHMRLMGIFSHWQAKRVRLSNAEVST